MSGKNAIPTIVKGKKGERIASEYLKTIGYQILRTNYITKNAELDIIAKDKKDLVIIEVKTGKNILQTLEDKIDKKKKRKIEQATSEFLYKNKMANHTIRFEVVAVTSPEYRIYHFREEFFN